MKALGEFEVWFLTGSQDLYGEETLRQVAAHSQRIAEGLDESASIPVRVVFKPVVKSPEGIAAACLAATAAESCVGVIVWMHTFSPARMWISGLQALQPHDVIDALLEAAGDQAGSIASHWSAQMPDVAALAVRLHAIGTAEARQGALELIDRLSALSAYGLDQARQQFER